MNLTATIDQSYLLEFSNCPLFFIKRYEYRTDNGSWVTEGRSLNQHIRVILSEDELNNLPYGPYYLFIANATGNERYVPINVVNPEIRGHWITIINSIFYLNNIGDIYAVKYLIWFLHYSNWNKFQLLEALDSYDIQSIPFILKNISKIGHCLSFRKQVQIKEVLKEFKHNYKIWSPNILYDALSYITPTIDIKRTNRCVFDLVDFVLEYDENPFIDNDWSIIEQSINTDSTCELIKVYKWLHNNSNQQLNCCNL